MTEEMPFKIRACPDGTYFDDEEFTHLKEDVLYVKVGNPPVETALRLLSEQGYNVSINVNINNSNETTPEMDSLFHQKNLEKPKTRALRPERGS
jgi:phosphotransferase system IIA component